MKQKQLTNQLLQSKGQEGDELNEKIEIVEALLDRMSRGSSIANPILIQILVDFANEPFTLERNLYLVYKVFIYKFVEIFMRKGFEAESEVVEFLVTSTDVIAFHQKQAVKQLLSGKGFGSLYENQIELSMEQMARVGLMLVVGTDRVHFIHRTFAEFFVADFFIKNLLAFNSQDIQGKAFVELFRQVWLYDMKEFRVIRNFFDGSFETLISSNNKRKPQVIKSFFQKSFSYEELSWLAEL